MNFETRQIDLLDYETWIGKSAGDILHVVKNKGGWSKAYPKGSEFPMWLSRIRNYFNECPGTITQLGVMDAIHEVRKVPMGKYLFYSAVIAAYRDDKGGLWFQTPPAGAVYHSKGEPGTSKAIRNTAAGQSGTEVFKLLQFDGSGGSSELILLNHAAWIAHNTRDNFVSRWISRRVHGGGRDFVRRAGEKISVAGLKIQDERYASSYNFGDFYYSDEPTHDRLDVKPHSIQKNFYAKVNQRSDLGSRIFPKAWAGTDLVDSDKHFKYGH